jgi:hypothetical protein
MSKAAAHPGDGDGLTGQERDAMVASLLGITPDRLRTIRRVHSKRVQDDGRTEQGTEGESSRWWQCVDQLDDDALFAAVRRREVRARVASRAGLLPPLDRTGRRATGRR